MPTIKIYHNPRCSKSRRTLELLRENGVDPEIVEYLNEPPTLEDLKAILKALGCPASTMVRTKEAGYSQAGLGPSSSEDAILKAIAENPTLLERPIVVAAERARIGRPPENVLDLL